MSITDLVTRHFADPQASWAIGTFGAIAEFHRDADEPVALLADGALTARGGIRLRVADAVRVVAWERPTAGDSWTHGMALCLAREQAMMSGRTVVTEVGPDLGTLVAEEQDALLFDLGIGAPHCDVCVRTADPVTLRTLRASAGRPLLKTGLFSELARLSPVRVFLSRLGRIEVRTPIPGPGGRTPDGPHTHVLPDLLRSRRTHSANVPLPAQMAPSAEIYPPSAIHDVRGERRAFDATTHDSFQTLLSAYGDPACIEAKRQTAAAVRKGAPPTDTPSYSRAQRLARRVALRQLAQTDGTSPALAAWRMKFDREGQAPVEES